MSACDACPKPGHCCTGFLLNGGEAGRGTSTLEALAFAARQGLPFLPFYRRSGGAWLWWCPVLGRDGRCTDYENRPALCRDYQPGSDSLCVLHASAEALQPTAIAP